MPTSSKSLLNRRKSTRVDLRTPIKNKSRQHTCTLQNYQETDLPCEKKNARVNYKVMPTYRSRTIPRAKSRHDNMHSQRLDLRDERVHDNTRRDTNSTEAT